jgi:hypothetical protein
MWGAIGQDDQISPLFHEGAQDVQLINLSILPLGGWLVHPASVSFGLGWPWAGVRWVVFPELSKLLHQEDALGAPCLDTVILALRRRALAGAQECCGQASIRHFDVTLRFATPDIRPASADAFAVVGGGCTGRAHGCKAKQGRRGKDGADV